MVLFMFLRINRHIHILDFDSTIVIEDLGDSYMYMNCKLYQKH